VTPLSFDRERVPDFAVGTTHLPGGYDEQWNHDKIKGATNEAVGKAKRAVGKATGSAKLKREGDIQEAKGDAQTAMSNVKKALKR
jgi:uncharacterized protein YjbJ (UPF0337 family)